MHLLEPSLAVQGAGEPWEVAQYASSPLTRAFAWLVGKLGRLGTLQSKQSLSDFFLKKGKSWPLVFECCWLMVSYVELICV